MKYSYKTVLKTNLFDNKGNLTPFAVLNFFQDAANVHGEMLGVSFEEMLKKNLLWVITRIYYEVCGNISAEDEIEVTTWPVAPSRLGYERDYLITDKNGNIIIKGSSNWALIDADTRRLAIVGNLYNTDNLCTERVFDTRIKRIRNFDAETIAEDIVPDKTMIDCNGHVNNTHYAAFTQRAVGGFSGKIKTFQIDYHHEVMCGQPLKMYTVSNDGTLLVKGENEDGTLMFCCVVELD